MKRIAIRLTSASLLFAASVHADTRLDYQSSSGDPHAILIKDNMIRMGSPDQRGQSMLVDLDQRQLIAIDHERQRFTRMNEADLAKAGNAVNEAMAQLEEQLQQMPPAQREMMRERMQSMMGGQMMGNVDISMEATGQSRSVAGYDCDVYALSVNGKLTSETCVVAADELDIPSADRATIDAVGAFMNELMKPLARFGVAMDEMMIRTDRIPVAYTNHSGQQTDSGELTSLSTDSLPAEAFSIPNGYREQSMDMPGR